MTRKLQSFFPEIFLFILSLTPLIWYIRKPGYIINGTDTNFPFDPVTFFVQRLFVFQDTINEGIDWPTATSGVFFHGLQVLVFIFTKNLALTQALTSIFWFFLVLFSMYYLLGVLISKENKAARLIGTIFYGFNIYLFNSWENIKVSNLSMIATTPLLLAFIYQIIRGAPSKRVYYFLLTSIFSFVGVGSAINPAYFFISLFTIITFGLFLAIKFEKKKKQMLALMLFLGVIFMVNAFWLLPLLGSLLGIYGQALTTLSNLTNLDWLNGLSKNTSLLAVIRFLGAWDWYEDGKGGIPYVPYASNYFNNPLFIFFSLVMPTLSILGFILSYRKGLSFYFLFIALIGLILGTGTHEPYGLLYKLATAKIPFFSFFRSPWYIFTPLTLLGFAFLIASFFAEIEKKLGKVRTYGLIFFILLSRLVYTFPLLTGDIFRPNKEIGQSFYVKPPRYIKEAEGKLKERPEQRFLSLPLDVSENFEWGYGGIGSIVNLFSDKNIIVYRFGLKEPTAVEIISNELMAAIKNGDSNKVYGLAALLGIDGYFLKHDLLQTDGEKPDFVWPKDIAVKDRVSAGPWEFITLPVFPEQIFASNRSISIFGDWRHPEVIFDIFTTDSKTIVFQDMLQQDVFGKDNNKSSVFILPNCIDCLLKYDSEDFPLLALSILPSSRLYRKTEEKERAFANKLQSSELKLDFYLNATRRLAKEIEQMVILKQPTRYITDSMRRLSRNWKEIMDIITLLETKNRDIAEANSWVLKSHKHLKEQVRLFNAISNSGLATLDVKLVSFNTLKDLLNTKKIIGGKEWKSTLDNKKFIFSSPLPGNYTIFIKEDPSYSRIFSRSFSSSSLLIDGTKIPLNKNNNSIWLTGSINRLIKGYHKMELDTPSNLNLLSDSDLPLNKSFENEEDIKKVTLPIKNYIPGALHKISFYYRTPQGVEPQVFVEQDTDRRDREGRLVRSLDSHLDHDSSWRKFEANFVPREGTRSMNLVFLLYTLDKVKTINEIKDLKVELVFETKIFLFNNVFSSPLSQLPTIVSRKDSPVRYTIEVTNATAPFPLVFLYKYSNGWKIRNESSLNWLPENKHFLVNSFANGWIIDQKGNFTLVIEYWPQYLFYFGGVAGIITFLLLFLVTLKKKVWK